MTAAVIRGSQVPTHRLVPTCDFSRGGEATGLAKIAGLILDPFQELLLVDGCGVNITPEGRERWTAREVAIELSRQNGKSAAIEARILAGLYLWDEQEIVYTAHKGETARKIFLRIAKMIEGTPELRAELKPRSGIRRANGQEGIELASGQTAWFRTRTNEGGKGLTADLLVIDEVQDANDDHMAALMPLVIAVPNAQIWYAGSAGGKHSTVEGALVRSMEAGAARLAMHRYAASDEDDRSDPHTWAKVNPAVGLAVGAERITVEALETAYGRLSPQKFDREHLGVGDYPRPPGEEWVIPSPAWNRCEARCVRGCDDDCDHPRTGIVGATWIAVEVRPDSSRSSVAVGGIRADGSRHGEIVANDIGSKWVADLVAQIRTKNPGPKVLLRPNGQAGALLGDFVNLDIEVYQVKSAEFAQACGWVYRAATEFPPGVYHSGGTVLTQSLANAFARPTAGGEAWIWSQHGADDTTPIIAWTLAVYGPTLIPPPSAPVSPRTYTERHETSPEQPVLSRRRRSHGGGSDTGPDWDNVRF